MSLSVPTPEHLQVACYTIGLPDVVFSLLTEPPIYILLATLTQEKSLPAGSRSLVLLAHPSGSNLERSFTGVALCKI